LIQVLRNCREKYADELAHDEQKGLELRENAAANMPGSRLISGRLKQ
jgi:hypothetical protein